MSGAFESTLLSPVGTRNKMFMETGFLVNGGHDGYNNVESVISDGATANRAAGIYGPFDAVNNPREYVAGAASLTLPFILPVPSSNPSSVAYLFIYASNASPNYTVANSLSSFIGADGGLYIITVGASYATNYRNFNFSGFREAYSGRTVLLKITFTQAGASPVVELNGVNISSSFTAGNGAGASPSWLDAAMVPAYRSVGNSWPSGPAPMVTPILGTTSAADDAFYMATGKWPAWVAAGGSAGTAQTTAFALIGGSGTLSAGSLTGFTLVGGIGYAGSTTSIVPIGGRKLRVSYTLTQNSGATTLPLLSFILPGQGQSATGVFAVAGSNDFIITCNGLSTVPIRLEFSSNTTDNFTISNFTFQPLGALSLPVVQPIAVFDDATTIGGNGARLLGMDTRSSSNKKVWRISDLTHTSGNKQVLGGSVFYGTSEDLITRWTIVNAGGTTIVSLGNVSGGTQYANAVSCPTGTTVITLLTTIPLTTNLWVNANTTAVLTHFIEGKRTV